MYFLDFSYEFYHKTTLKIIWFANVVMPYHETFSSEIMEFKTQASVVQLTLLFQCSVSQRYFREYLRYLNCSSRENFPFVVSRLCFIRYINSFTFFLVSRSFGKVATPQYIQKIINTNFKPTSFQIHFSIFVFICVWQSTK